VSERLTEEELDEVIGRTRANEAAFGLTCSRIERLVEEVRSRRAADIDTRVVHGQDDGTVRTVYLTGREMNALQRARNGYASYPPHDGHGRQRHAESIATLDKLLARSP